MGKNTKHVKSFIEKIPDSKLTGMSDCSGTIYKDRDFRLDMQGMTSGNPQKYNLQVQVNRETTISSLKKSAPQSVSIALVPTDGSWSAKTVKAELIKKIAV